MTLPQGLPQSLIKFNEAFTGVSWTVDVDVFRMSFVDSTPKSPSNFDEISPLIANVDVSSVDVLMRSELIGTRLSIRSEMK